MGNVFATKSSDAKGGVTSRNVNRRRPTVPGPVNPSEYLADLIQMSGGSSWAQMADMAAKMPDSKPEDGEILTELSEEEVYNEERCETYFRDPLAPNPSKFWPLGPQKNRIRLHNARLNSIRIVLLELQINELLD